MNWIYALIAGGLSGVISALGLGGGTVLLLYLALFTSTPQIEAQGINLLFFIPCAVMAVLLHLRKKRIIWRPALLAAAGGLFGAVGGALLADYLSGDWLRKLFAGLLFIIGIREVVLGLRMKKEKSQRNPSDLE